MSFNSDEVNFLVYRYLEESGFHHTAYMFGYESSVLNAGIDGTLVPRGALMSLVQKGILFAEAEVFSLLTEGDIETKFEKAVGSMSLIECTLPESTKVKLFEKKIRDEAISRTCSPHPSTSTASGSCGGNVGGTTTITAAMTTPESATLSTATTTAATESYPLPAIDSSSGKTGSAAENSAAQRTQLQRDREFRGHQSVAASSEGDVTGGGPPPRGNYRTTAGNEHKSFASHSNLHNSQAHSTTSSFSSTAASSNSSYSHYQQQINALGQPPASFANVEGMDSNFLASVTNNGLGVTTAQSYTAKLAEVMDSRVGDYLTGSQQRFLTTNGSGNYTAGHGGKKAAAAAAAAAAIGGAPLSNAGSVFLNSR